MTCQVPPELDDRELLAYVDGRADAQVVKHVEQCPHCRERARRLRHLQERLTARLYRVTCPPPIELGQHRLNMLPSDQAEAVTRHLAECPHCAREFAQLDAFLDKVAPSLEASLPEQVRERVRVLIARLVSSGEKDNHTRSPALAPAHAGLRGEEVGPYLYQADDAQIAIEVQGDAQDRKVLLGLFIGADPGGLQAHLWQAGQLVTTVPVDELGNFVIPHLDPGCYELILSSPETEIYIQGLNVGAGYDKDLAR
jgi:anti-sigma factor RsiW